MGDNNRFPAFGFESFRRGINRKRGYSRGYLQELVGQRSF
jgi:hypothetical protein